MIKPSGFTSRFFHPESGSEPSSGSSESLSEEEARRLLQEIRDRAEERQEELAVGTEVSGGGARLVMMIPCCVPDGHGRCGVGGLAIGGGCRYSV